MASKKLNLRPLGDRLVVEPQEKEEQDDERHHPAGNGQGETAGRNSVGRRAGSHR